MHYHFNWKTLSAIAGITWWNFYFCLFAGAIRAPQVVEFLERLLRHLPGLIFASADNTRWNSLSCAGSDQV